MNPFTFDLGYSWLLNYGHLIAIVAFGGLAALGIRLGFPRFVNVIAIVLATWGIVGLVIVQLVLRMNMPLELPSDEFLPGGTGTVLDGGAGSGRSSLMVLRARPEARVVAVDIYEGYWGIADNTPARLMANAAKADAEGRIEVRVGDLRELPMPDDSFDAAVSSFVIDHLSREGVERSLAEIERVVRPQGEFLLMVINPDIWIRVAYPFFVHHGYFGPKTNHERWRNHLTDAGFEIVEQGTKPGVLYLIGRTSASRPEPTTDG